MSNALLDLVSSLEGIKFSVWRRYQDFRRTDREMAGGVVCSPFDRLFFVFPSDIAEQAILDRLIVDNGAELLPGYYSLGRCRKQGKTFSLVFDRTFEEDILIELFRIVRPERDFLDWFSEFEVINGANSLGKLVHILA